MTPTLSVEAFQASETVVSLCPVTRSPPGAVGAEVSGWDGNGWVGRAAVTASCPLSIRPPSPVSRR